MKAELTPIPYAEIAIAALSNAESLLRAWLPDGTTKSGEYKVTNPNRADNKVGSFSINVRTGKWGDFATNDAGNDLISLYAYLEGVEQWQAAIDIADQIGFSIPDSCRPKTKQTKPRAKPLVDPETIKQAKPTEESPWQPVMPVPADAIDPPLAHTVRGLPAMKWQYKDAQGQCLGYVYRFNTSDGGKETLPLTYCKNNKTEKYEWRWMQWPAPNRPIYGLDRLAAKPDAWVLLVEGEKCADAPVDLLPNAVVVSWSGGSKAIDKTDWTPLAGRNIYAWSDCDAQRKKLTKTEVEAGLDPLSQPLLPEVEQPGIKAMLAIGAKLQALDPNTKFKLVDIPKPLEKPSGWDIADAIDEGMNGAALIAFITKTRPEIALVEANDKDKKSPLPKKGQGNQQDAKDKPKKPIKVIDWDRFQRLCDNFVLIYTTDTVFDVENRLIMKVNALRLAYGADYVKMWLGSDKRRMIYPQELVFDPSETCQPPCINLFNGLAITPRAGVDITPIFDLIEHLCANSASNAEFNEVVQWVTRWLAYPLQHRGAKMLTAMIFHGPQGAGKNLLFEIVAAIYGEYAMVVGQDQLEDKFNDWASQKMFLIGDEVVARTELYHQKNKLKAFITGSTIQINPKGLPLRTESNHCNVVFLSNEHQPLALEVGDRRYMVVYTPPKREDDLYARVEACKRAGGIEAFYHYLITLDLDDFAPHTLPIMTNAKRDLISLNLRPEERFAYDLAAEEIPLPLTVCSTKQLYEGFLRWSRMNGYKFTPDQNTFTSKISKTFASIGTALKKNPVMTKLKVRMPAGYEQKMEYIWVPDGCGPKDGVTIGDFAVECIAEFKQSLSKYGRNNHEE